LGASSIMAATPLSTHVGDELIADPKPETVLVSHDLVDFKQTDVTRAA